MCLVHLRNGELCAPSSKVEGLSSEINYLELFCMGDLSILLYLFISRIISIIKNSWILFILWVILQYYFILFLKNSSFGHSISVCWLLCPFDPHLHAGGGLVSVSEDLPILLHLKVLQPPLLYVPFQS